MLVTTPCLCCGKEITVEARWLRRGSHVAFCGRRCNLRKVARDGEAAVLKNMKERELKDLDRAGYLDPDPHSESADC